MSWVPGQEGTLYTAGYLVHDQFGFQTPQPGELAGPEWTDLELNHWYRATTMVDFATNQVVRVAIKDLATNIETTVDVVDWYLEGGSVANGGSTSDMTGFRFFAGGGTAGNSLAFDNLNVEDRSGTPVQPATWGGIKAQFEAGTREAPAPAPRPSVSPTTN
jgi:hypothetical protein